MNAFRSISFTARLVLVAFLVAVIPIVVAYAAMSRLPERLASDALELALRESSGNAVTAIREQNIDLRERIATVAQQEAFLDAVARRDRTTVRRMLDAGSELQFEFRSEEPRRAERSPVSAVLGVTGTQRNTFLYVHRAPDAAFADELAADAPIHIAMLSNDRLLARSQGFPETLKGSEMAARQGNSALSRRLRTVDDNGRERLIFITPIDLSTPYRLAVMPSEALRRSTIEAPQREITRALIALGIASIAFALTGAAVLNRSVRQFSDQTRALAEGDYSRRLPVLGHDAFSTLASNYNTLAAELEHRITELESAAARFSRTLETIEEGVCLWNDEGEIELWNRGAAQLTDISLAELTPGHRLYRFLSQQRAVGRRRLPLPIERSGQRVTVDMVVSRVPDGGILQTFRDITAQELLQQTQRNFMTTAAHELRTPLTTILGFSQTLLNTDLELTDEQRQQFLTLINEQSEHLQRLTESFFDNQQLANERAEITVTNVYLAQAIDTGIDKAQIDPSNPAERHSYEVDIDVPPDLEVRGDFRAIAGVVGVLVDNAHKYGEQPIRVKARRYGTSVVMSVEDAGSGIDRQHLARIWDPFYRVDVNMRGGVGGAGLGLFTARKLVTAMKGEITVDSAPGKGATFTVELPVAETSQHERVSAAEVSTRTGPSGGDGAGGDGGGGDGRAVDGTGKVVVEAGSDAMARRRRSARIRRRSGRQRD